MHKKLNTISIENRYENSSGIWLGTQYMAGISDVYGGVTNNIIVGERGHWDKEEKGSHKGEYTYWYDPETGERTGNQEKELWAHYFSFEMLGDAEVIKVMDEYFPNTMQQYGDMATEMTEYYRK